MMSKQKFAPLVDILRKPPTPKQLAGMEKHGIVTVFDLAQRINDERLGCTPRDAVKGADKHAVFIDDVFDFCNESLGHVMLDIKRAEREGMLIMGKAPRDNATRKYIVPVRGDFTPQMDSFFLYPTAKLEPGDGDFVVAEDGYTYDRDKIARYVRTHGKSPVTGEAMGATFYTNRFKCCDIA